MRETLREKERWVKEKTGAKTLEGSLGCSRESQEGCGNPRNGSHRRTLMILNRAKENNGSHWTGRVGSEGR